MGHYIDFAPPCQARLSGLFVYYFLLPDPPASGPCLRHPVAVATTVATHLNDGRDWL